MKKGAIFVNTSRGGIVNEEALINAIEGGTVSCAGLDVFETEPLPANKNPEMVNNDPCSAWFAVFSDITATDDLLPIKN